ncbi:DUF2798 domain-containing protein [Dictyobacter arantiisoli]|uniref:DUF2798 domain-containing protein n=1 Tax=Dictyobacter arantiisoli TaxID=2014874 RepID=UPI0011EDA4D8|nr:DUF2798 domain-containing protein [Dictyobacter arantiisoli]
MGIFISIVMTIPASFVLTLISMGFTPAFAMMLITNTLIGIAISIPVAIVAVPVVRVIVSKCIIQED